MDDFQICLDELFFQIKPLFANQKSFALFLNQLIARLRTRKDLMLEQINSQGRNLLEWAIYYATNKCVDMLNEFSRNIESSSLQEIITKANKINAQMSFEQKHDIVDQLKDMLAFLAVNGKIYKKSPNSKNINAKEPLTRDDIENLSKVGEIYFKCSDGTFKTAGLSEVIQTIIRVESEKQILEIASVAE